MADTFSNILPPRSVLGTGHQNVVHKARNTFFHPQLSDRDTMQTRVAIFAVSKFFLGILPRNHFSRRKVSPDPTAGKSQPLANGSG